MDVECVYCRAISLCWKFLFAFFIFVDSSRKERSRVLQCVLVSVVLSIWQKKEQKRWVCGDYIASLCLCRAVKGKIHNKLFKYGNNIKLPPPFIRYKYRMKYSLCMKRLTRSYKYRLLQPVVCTDVIVGMFELLLFFPPLWVIVARGVHSATQ